MANRASITARMEQGAKHMLYLLSEGKQDEVARLMERLDWGVDDDATMTQDNQAM